jgi:hypothetical protein
MKLREWQIHDHLVSLLGDEDDVYGNISDFCLRIWRLRPGFAVYQNGSSLQVEVEGLTGRPFNPDLSKINSVSIDSAIRFAAVPDYSSAYEYGVHEAIEKLFS